MVWWVLFFSFYWDKSPSEVTFRLFFMVLSDGGTVALCALLGLPCTKPSWGHAHGLAPRPPFMPGSVLGEAQGGGSSS